MFDLELELPMGERGGELGKENIHTPTPTPILVFNCPSPTLYGFLSLPRLSLQSKSKMPVIIFAAGQYNIYYIFFGCSNKNLIFSHLKIMLILIKRQQIGTYLSSKLLFWTQKLPFAKYFLRLPHSDPRNLCASTGIRIIAERLI